MDNTYFSPTSAVQRGQQIEQGLSQAELEGMSLRERLALKKAAGAMGSQNYFVGYEGVPGAQRPAYLKEAWMNADPAEAMKLEALQSEPFKVQRGVETAGKIEAAKKASDLEYNKNMMREFFASEGGQSANAFGSAMAGTPSPVVGTTLPTSPSVESSQALAPSPALSATERSFEVGPQGPKFALKRMSPFEQSMKVSEDEARKSGTQLARETFNQKDMQDAISNVQAAQRTFREAQAAQFENPNAAGQVDLANQELKLRRQELEAVQRRLGQSSPSASAPPSNVSSVEPPSELTGYDPQGELTHLPTQTSSAPTLMPSSRTMTTSVSSASPFGIPGAEHLSGKKQQEVGEKEVILARDRGRGQQVVRTVVESLRDQFKQLNAMGGLTNTEQNALQNATAGASSSGPGQLAGKLFGTKTQSLRNTIAQQRPILMQAIRAATGMSAKQMDSNVELKLYLGTATDPTLDFQTNMKALDTIEKLFGRDIEITKPTIPQAPVSVAPFKDAAKERRYQDFKKQHQ